MKKPRPAMNEAEDRRAASAVPIVPRLYCGGCETNVEPVLFWNERHLQANCPTCCRYIKHVPQVAPWIDLAPPKVIRLSMFEGVA